MSKRNVRPTGEAQLFHTARLTDMSFILYYVIRQHKNIIIKTNTNPIKKAVLAHMYKASTTTQQSLQTRSKQNV